MKQHWKTYIISVLISAAGAVLPWILGMLDVLSKGRVLDRYAPVCTLTALAIALVYVIRHAKSVKSRIVIMLCNPVVYYFLGLMLLLAMFAAESWNGFHLT